VLREGLARNPRAAVLHHALGLSLTRQKRAADSLGALREAVEIAPDDARFAYVYAVALHSAGRSRDALKVLESALQRHPYDRDLLSGLAHFNAQAGNRDAALSHAKQLRALDPENAEYGELAASIEGRPGK